MARGGFSLRVPPSWFSVDAGRSTDGDLGAHLGRMVENRLEHAPERARTVAMLHDVAAHARRAGAVFCAAAADEADDAGTLLACVMAFRTPSDPAQSTVEAIADALSAGELSQQDGSRLWPRVEILDLPSGRAVRVTAMERTEDGAPAVVMQNLWPVPGGDGVLNVVLTSRQTRSADALLDLFDAISGTVAWPDEPEITPRSGIPCPAR